MTDAPLTTRPDETKTSEKKPIKSAKKTASAKRALTSSAKKNSQQTQPLTDEQKRLARNAYVRAWRRAHPDRVAATMKAYRDKKAKEAGKATTKKKASSNKTSFAKKTEESAASPSATSGGMETPAA